MGPDSAGGPDAAAVFSKPNLLAVWGPRPIPRFPPSFRASSNTKAAAGQKFFTRTSQVQFQWAHRRQLDASDRATGGFAARGLGNDGVGRASAAGTLPSPRVALRVRWRRPLKPRIGAIIAGGGHLPPVKLPRDWGFREAGNETAVGGTTWGYFALPRAPIRCGRADCPRNRFSIGGPTGVCARGFFPLLRRMG